MSAAIDVLTFPHDRVALDLLLWRAYGREVPGLVEDTLARNPGLAELGAFPPRGTRIRVLRPGPAAAVTVRPLVRIY